MHRLVALTAGLLGLATTSLADDAISPEVLRAVKQATVYIRVEGPDWSRSGSGFVVRADGGTVLVVTNHHVAGKRPAVKTAPAGPAITIVFDSGTRSERSYAGELVASDAERDLAVLRVAGVKEVPKPVGIADPVTPIETMAVFTFGFPFGQDLSTGKGSPAVTVGRASISSLRTGDDGELKTIQIDGNLNPGNSGGPVVDGKGRLVGVAVAILKEGQGIGFLVPAVEVVRTMEGRVGRVRVATRTGADGKPAVRVEADLIDPAGAFRGATAHYLVLPPRGKKPDAAALEQHPGSRKLALKVEKGVAAAEFAVEKMEGEVLVQVVAERTAGKSVATRVRGYSLYPGPRPADLAGPPPDGWTDYVAKDRSFAVWLPARPDRQEEKQRNLRVNREGMQAIGVAGRTASGLEYRAEALTLPPSLGRLPPPALHLLLRSALADEESGRVAQVDEVSTGLLSGVQYRLDLGDEIARLRVYIDLGRRVRVVRVSGPADLVDAPEAETILRSYRLPGDALVAKAPEAPAVSRPPVPGPKPGPRPRPGADPDPVTLLRELEPTIIAGGFAPQFKDVAPDGGLLIGLELGLGKFFQEDVIKSVRPIYRVGGKEQFGSQRGVPPSPVVTIKAKDGYAVGAITCKSGLNFDGCSLTFMKVVGDKLDPGDAYESEWVGYVGRKQPTRIGGDGTPVVGLAGRGSDREVNGLGLLFQGQEEFVPNAPPLPRGKRVLLVSKGKDPFIFGTIRDPQFKTVGPAGAVLVGVEARFEPFGDKQMVRGVRPIYRVGGKEEFGEQFGNDLSGSVTLRAKEGYAVGGMSARSEWWCHGFSLTFMKVKPDGTLDPKDRFESEWAGWSGEIPTTRLTGDGTPVVGLVGKIVGTKTTALGLLFRGQEGFDPTAGGR
jgi:S1-C subfamily serine protease